MAHAPLFELQDLVAILHCRALNGVYATHLDFSGRCSGPSYKIMTEHLPELVQQLVRCASVEVCLVVWSSESMQVGFGQQQQLETAILLYTKRETGHYRSMRM